jgi:pSer/pThr/pTyr-binding forkhead associated (FHA) protein
MPRLILQFENRVLKECSVGLMVTIGRLPDNTLMIDNPAVSSHHACVFRAGDDYIVEDLESTNGTFVNEKRVTRQTLQNGDVVLVGKHTLIFDQLGGDPVVSDEAKPLMAKLGETVFLDTEQHKALLAKLNDGQPDEAGVLATTRMPTVPSTPAKTAVLRVIGGGANHRTEYNLDAHTSLIGKGDASLIRLKGWLKPKVAVAITRNGQGYVITRLGGSTTINGAPLAGRHGLKDGDVLRISGLTLEFRMKG